MAENEPLMDYIQVKNIKIKNFYEQHKSFRF